METTGKTWIQFNFRYYFYALIFVTLERWLFFLSLAVQLKQLGATALVTILVFMIIIAIGYIYAWKKKALESTKQSAAA